MPTLPTAEIDHALAIGGEDIKARKVATRMTVAVNVNGKGPYRFVVDSGADTSVVGRRIAESLALPAGTPVVLNGITESRVVDRVKLATLRVGPSEIADLQVPVLAEGDIGAEGMLGLDALVASDWCSTSKSARSAWMTQHSPNGEFSGEIVVTARLNRGQLILTAVKIGADRPRSDHRHRVGSHHRQLRAARRSCFAASRANSRRSTVSGVTGAVAKLELLRVPELRIGGVTLQNVPIAFADVPPFAVFGIADRPALLLGTDLMESFRKVSLDFDARKVRFQLRRCDSTRINVATLPSATATRLSANSSTPAVCAR